MRVVHTSDWHLGHTLHEMSRRHEHQRFLQWLLELLEKEEADALIVAGDVFDVANPSAEAQTDYFSFLTEARRRLPELGIVVVGGNHDSASRLDAPAALLDALGIHVVGGHSFRDPVDRLLVPLKKQGRVEAWLCALPFLRPADLPKAESGDPLIEGVRLLYAEVVSAALQKRQPGQALLATGHLYMTGTELSELSERRILGGNQHALPVDLFPEELAYVALGHLHKAQRVGGREGVRYCGSPIPLSFSETKYVHQICVVELEGEALKQVRSVPVPRSVELLRLPEGGPAPLPELLSRLSRLPERASLEYEELPFLEVSVLLEKPEPGLRAILEEVLKGKAARLVRIVVERGGSGESAADSAQKPLKELQPEEVFRLAWGRHHEGDPPPELLSAFHELIDAAGREAA